MSDAHFTSGSDPLHKGITVYKTLLYTVVIMGFVYLDCDFGLDFKPHPEHEKLEKDIQDWLTDIKLVKPAEISKYVSRAAYTSHIFADCPYSERLVLVNRWFILEWIVDNELRDEIVPGEKERKIHEEYVKVFRDGTTKSDFQIVHEVAAVQNKMKELADPEWYEAFRSSLYQGAKWAHEMVFEKKLTKPDMATAIVGRAWEGLFLSTVTFHEFLDEQYLPSRIRSNPGYYMLLMYANEASTFYSDYISWEKELQEQNIYMVFRAIQAKNKLTDDQFQEVSNEFREVVMDSLDKFKVVANRIDELFDEKDGKIMQRVVKRIHRYIQGNKDFHFICPGYISKDAIITNFHNAEA